MPLSEEQEQWYTKQIRKLDPNGEILRVDETNRLIVYDKSVRTDVLVHRELEFSASGVSEL